MSDSDTEKTVSRNNRWHDNVGCPLMVMAICAMLAFMVHSCNEYMITKLHACDSECSCSKQIEEKP